MKSLISLLSGTHIISVVVTVTAACDTAIACGPSYDCIPTPVFFISSWSGMMSTDFNKAENIRLWQELTSADIPATDIEKAVYKDSYQEVLSHSCCNMPDNSNRFYTCLYNTSDKESYDFLLLAKEIERRRAAMASPWYYPEERYGDEGGFTDFDDLIEQCKAYSGSRLRDRYGLQLVRVLFASRRYDECIAAYDEAFAGIGDDNLFKRMALDYVAGCWAHLGDTDRANEHFARAGSFRSLDTDNNVAFMAARNPDAPELMAYIQSCAGDSATFCGFWTVAEQVLAEGMTSHPGDWEFLLAYIDGFFHGDISSARRHIASALRRQFSSDDFRDHARAYRMLLDAQVADRSSLYSDLQWLEKRILDKCNGNAWQWNRMLQNIVFGHWLPALWKKGEYTTAVLLTGYAENLLESHRYHQKSIDYGGLTFQVMNSLSSRQMESVKNGIAASRYPLYTLLKRYTRHDDDYLDELIGTLALREQNYGRAVDFLSRVSIAYQRSMNIYGSRSLLRDPFVDCRMVDAPEKRLAVCDNAKLNFARRMLQLQHETRHGATADDRGLARLDYAIGLRNSFGACWALTQYWSGWCDTRFCPSDVDYPTDDASLRLTFIYDYEDDATQSEMDKLYKEEVAAALDMLATDEARAQANLTLGNLVTIVRRYGDTDIAAHIKASCDNWKNWL